MPKQTEEPVKTIFFFCYRMMEFKLFVNAEILQEVLKFSRLVIFVPDDFCDECVSICPENVTVLPIKHPSFKLGTVPAPTMKVRVEALLRNVFSLTYANRRGCLPCHSQKPQIRAYLRAKTNRTLVRRIISVVVVALALLASRVCLVRKIIQRVLFILLVNDRHRIEFLKFKPSLVVVGSMGVDMDGSVLSEARAFEVKTLVVNQSWDRMVTKGYPPISPDYLIVWNEHMRSEAEQYLDMPRDAISVEGAAPFDFLFRKYPKFQTKKEFFKKLNLDEGKITFLFPLPSSFWHDDTLDTLEKLTKLLSTDIELVKKQFIIRLHPYYWGQPKLLKPLLARLEVLKKFKNVYVDLNKVDVRAKTVFIDRDDQATLLKYYRYCNACMSVGSTVMIEMSCMKKPVFNILFGNWVTPNESIPWREHRLHHLVELQKYSTISNALTFDQLMKQINEFDGSTVMNEDLENFINREIGPNKGKAGIAVAKRIRVLVNKAYAC